ncbi:MAG: 2-dehydropantoate 2-reductase [Nitrospinota bacterium]|nr:2-dehydropantoate 2-reductase [Nitrospinota bacterium]
MSRIAVVGAGSIGCVFGARLSYFTSHEIIFCVRTPFDTIKVTIPSGVDMRVDMHPTKRKNEGEKVARKSLNEINCSVHCVTDPSEVSHVDWVLLAVKGHQVKGASDWMRALCSTETSIAVLQNGVEHVERVAPFSFGAKVVPVVVNCPADRFSPGEVTQNSHAKLIASDTEEGRFLQQIFAETDLSVELTSDFATESWSKLCVNVAAGPATAITSTGRGIVSEPAVSKVCYELTRECAEVARAEGALLPLDFAERVIERIHGQPANGTTSMLGDKLAGNPLEADAMTGAVIRFAEKHGISVPTTKTIHAFLMQINQKHDFV